MLEIDCSSGEIKDLEIRGVPLDLVEKILYMCKLEHFIKELVPGFYKEYVRFFLVQFVFRSHTNLEMEEWKVLRKHCGKDIMDDPFRLAEELEGVAKTVCFPHSHKIERLLKLVKSR